MNNFRFVFFCFCLYTLSAFAQLYQGPANGSVASGVIVSTGSVKETGHVTNFKPKPIRNIFSNSYYPNYPGMPKPTGPEGSNYMVDPNAGSQKDFTLTNNFQALPDQGYYIPPDPYLAVGPQEIMALVNSRFAIMNKSGQISKTIEIANWYNTTLAGCDPFDPKVIYDHYAKRWIMCWLNVDASSTVAYYLISVSDDSTAAGTWYNWKLPSTTNGNTASSTWADYQGLGYDQNAIYITSNQFSAAGQFQYAKLRIIPKTDLYANTAGQVTWKDIWDIRHPDGSQYAAFGIRPARMNGNSSNYYIVGRSPYVTGTYFTVWTLTNPLTSPALTANNVTVTQYSDPNDMGQLGSTYTIDGGASNYRNEPFYQDGKLYGVHAVKSGTGNAFSAVRYFAIDVSNYTAVEDKAMGVDNFFHSYPALAVDAAGNVAITYSRSGTTEYAGAFYTTKPAGATVLTGSKLLKAGNGSYYKTFGGTRNRWGDYLGAWTDPSNRSKIYVMSEYAASTNTWGTWIGELTFSNTAASVTVTAPNGGELWVPGTSKNITWLAANIATLKIEYSTNNGTNWLPVATGVSGAAGTYAWTVPGTVATQCKVKLTNEADATIFDMSDGVFTIGQMPTGGWELITTGMTGDIWGIDYADNDNVWISSSTGEVKRSTDGGATFIAAGNPGDGTYAIAALSPTSAVVATGPSSGDGKIFRTTNGGTTWTQVYTASGAWFNFIDNIDANNLWALSDPIPAGGQFHIVKSTDGGATWALASNRPTAPSSTVYGANNAWYQMGGTNLWFGTGGASGATTANKIYKSTAGIDGPWTSATCSNQFTGAMAFSSASGNGLVGFWQATNAMDKTTNGGTSFSALTTTTALTHGLDYIPGTTTAYCASSTGLYKTTNNGTSWTAETLPSGATGEFLFVRLYNNGAQGMVGGQAGILLRKAPSIPVAAVFVTSPNGGESWQAATQHNITWSSTLVANVKIEYTTNNGISWVTLAASVPATPASFTWTIPHNPTSQAKVRISDVTNAATMDMSDNVFTITPAPAQYTWRAPLVVKDAGTDSLAMEFGTSPQATDGMDQLLGELPLPPMPPTGVFDSRFELPINPADYSVKDYRNDSLQQVSWVVKFQPGVGGYPITLKWNPNTLPAGTFTLKDLITGALINVNMKTQSQYSITSSGIVGVKIEFSRQLCKDVVLASGWNILSVPVSAASMAARILFPASTSPAWGYNNNYVMSAGLELGKGYFLRYPQAATINICGNAAPSNTVALNAGWNIVGPHDINVLVSNVTTTPANIINSSFFEYSTGYQAATTLAVGKGYWVRASQAGTLNLPATMAKSGEGEVVSLIDKSWSKIIVKDAEGNVTTLYLALGSVKNYELYDLPPVPPAGVFDARFGSQKLVEMLNGSTQDLQINNAVYPVELFAEGVELNIADKATSGRLFSAVLKSGSSIKINDPAISVLEFQGAGRPTDFALFQNFPNPFNPSTTIKYSVPEKARVQLTIFNQLGQKVAELFNGEQEAGLYQLEWNASSMPSGVYFYELKTEKFSSVKKLLLMK